ncbi:MAG TPA: histidinol dehydrogenase, partial [Chromatiales bacterium]|nr:histidinol dehydrogenase [Chromatiales bacterium]
MSGIRRLDTGEPEFWSRLDALLAWEPGAGESVEQTVREILAAVRRRGDAALLEYT